MPCDARALTRLLAAAALLAVLFPSPLRAQSSSGAGPASASSPTAAANNVVREVLPSKPWTGALFTEIHLRDLPGAGDLWTLIETADELSVVDRIANGGLYLGEPRLMGNIGSSWTQAGFTVDGLDVTNPARTGTPLLYPDPQVLGSLHVFSSLPAVDLAGGGPTVAIAPRAPATQWGGSLQASYLPNPLQASFDNAEAPPIAHFGSAGDGSLLLSGPIGSNAGLLLSGRRAHARRLERTDPTPLDSRVTSLFLHTTLRPSPGGQLRVVATTDAISRPFASRARYPDRSVTARDQFWHAHGIWEHSSSGGTTWSAAAGYDRGVSGAPAPGGSPVVGVVERLRDGPIPELVSVSGGVQQRIGGVFRLRPAVGSRHTLDLGLSLARTGSSSEPMPRALVGELVDGLPARAWDYTWGGATSRRATELAGWLNERVEFSRVTLEGGARFELTRATARDNPTGINWQSLLPRGLLRLNLTRSGSLSFSLGYGSYRHRLPLDYLAFGDPSAHSGLVYRWNDRNGDGQLQAPEMGTLLAVAGPGARPGNVSGIDPNLRAPRTSEFTVGFQARLGQHWRARLFGVERYVRRLVAPVDAGVTLADYIPRDVWDRGNDFHNPVDDRYLRVYDRRPSSFGRDAALLTNAPDHDGNNVAADFVLERLFDGRWYMLFGFSAQRSDGYAGNPGFLVTENDTGVQGALFEDPNALSYARGRLFFERGYICKWSGGFVTANDIHFGTIARYQDGQHFARLVIVPDLNQGPEAIQAYTRGHSRFTFTFTLDARVEKGFRAGWGRVALVAETFNLLNNLIQVEEDPAVTREFRATTAVQPPRVFRLGVRVDF